MKIINCVYLEKHELFCIYYFLPGVGYDLNYYPVEREHCLNLLKRRNHHIPDYPAFVFTPLYLTRISLS